MKFLNIMGFDFTYKAALKGFTSATVKRRWNDIGVLKIAINESITNADEIAQNDILWFDNDTHVVFIVERIEQELRGSEIVLNITAPEAKQLLEDYITVPPSGSAYDSQTGTRESVVRAWVDNNAINPADASRALYNIALGTNNSLGDSITEQTRYKNLADEVSRILSPQDYGWRLSLDIDNSQFLFEVVEGVDRTIASTIRTEKVSDSFNEPSDFSTGTLSNVEVGDTGLELASVDPTWNEVDTSKTWEELDDEFI